MKILHVYKRAVPFSTGGIEHVIDEVCRENHRLGHENTIVCLQPGIKAKKIITLPYAQVIAFPENLNIASCGFSWELLREFRQICRHHDVVHFQFPWPFADMLSMLTDKPYMVSYQSDIVRQKRWMCLYSPLMRRFLNQASKITVSSPELAKSSSVLQKLDRPIDVVPNGIDDTAETSQETRFEYFRQRFRHPFILFIGAFRYYKGIHVLLDAAALCDAEIVICGMGKLHKDIEARIQQEGLKNVHLFGFASEADKNALLKTCTALVLPSVYRSEAYGMVLVEAARMGRAMISTQLQTGTSFINHHNETGFVVPPGDAEALASAIQKIVSNPEKTQEMGRAARRRYQSLFTVTSMGKSLDALYYEILDHNN